MSKLSDKQRKKIIAEHLEGASTRCLAKKYKVSDTTIRRTIKQDPEVAEKVAHKKAENVASVLAHMDARKQNVCELIDKLVDAIGNPEKIEKATVNQLATAMGILIDKYTANEQFKSSVVSENNLLEALNNCSEEGLDDLPELQQAAETDDAVVEDAESPE